VRLNEIITSRTNGKQYRVTRISETHIWIRWVAYGDRRGLSHRLLREYVEENYDRPNKESHAERR